jgi:hypothetical protein
MSQFPYFKGDKCHVWHGETCLYEGVIESVDIYGKGKYSVFIRDNISQDPYGLWKYDCDQTGHTAGSFSIEIIKPKPPEPNFAEEIKSMLGSGDSLIAENDRLRKLVVSMAERIFAQSDLLSKKSEK